jgi:hypothetical protein
VLLGRVSGQATVNTAALAAGLGANLHVFPNPATSETVIRYSLPAGTSEATLLLFNMVGAEVKRWAVRSDDAGQVTVSGLAAGTYMYQLRSASGSLGVQRSVVVR